MVVIRDRDSEDMILVFHVILQGQVIKGSCDLRLGASHGKSLPRHVW